MCASSNPLTMWNNCGLYTSLPYGYPRQLPANLPDTAISARAGLVTTPVHWQQYYDFDDYEDYEDYDEDYADYYDDYYYSGDYTNESEGAGSETGLLGLLGGLLGVDQEADHTEAGDRLDTGQTGEEGEGIGRLLAGVGFFTVLLPSVLAGAVLFVLSAYRYRVRVVQACCTWGCRLPSPCLPGLPWSPPTCWPPTARRWPASSPPLRWTPPHAWFSSACCRSCR